MKKSIQLAILIFFLVIVLGSVLSCYNEKSEPAGITVYLVGHRDYENVTSVYTNGHGQINFTTAEGKKVSYFGPYKITY